MAIRKNFQFLLITEILQSIDLEHGGPAFCWYSISAE